MTFLARLACGSMWFRGRRTFAGPEHMNCDLVRTTRQGRPKSLETNCAGEPDGLEIHGARAARAAYSSC